MKKLFFTLIELLVVIAIIAILASLLLPTLSKTRDMTRTIACLSQLKQLSVGRMMYCDAYNGGMEPPNTPYWTALFVHNGFISSSLLACPSRLAISQEPLPVRSLLSAGTMPAAEDNWRWMGSDYGVNYEIIYGGARKLSFIKSPATMIDMIESNNGVNPIYGHFWVYSWYQDNQHVAYPPHAGGKQCNANFVDGHAVTIRGNTGTFFSWSHNMYEGGMPLADYTHDNNPWTSDGKRRY